MEYEHKRLSDQPPRIIDFTRVGWGHNLFTFYKEEHPKRLTRWIDKRKKRRRYNVLVICSPAPDVGDTIKYKAESGIMEAIITGVHYYWNPHDMFDVQLLIDPTLSKDAVTK
jgi:hypothetical protein